MFVYDLDNEINNFESKTYLKLCRISGRPTFRHLYLRSCNIILSQSKFSEWCQNTSNLRTKMSKFQSKLVSFSLKNENLYNYKINKDFNRLYLNQPSKNKTVYVGLSTCTLSRRLSYHLQNGAILKHSLDTHQSKSTRRSSIVYIQLVKNTSIDVPTAPQTHKAAPNGSQAAVRQPQWSERTTGGRLDRRLPPCRRRRRRRRPSAAERPCPPPPTRCWPC